MKKVFSILFSIVIVIALSLLALNMSIQDMAVDTIHDSLVKKKLSDVITDVVIKEYPNMDVNDLEKINDTIQNSLEAREITEKYFEDIMNEITSGDVDVSVKIETDIENLIDNHKEEFSSYGIDIEKIDEIKEEVLYNSNMDEIYEVVREQLPTNLTNEQQMVVNGYQFIHSNTLKYILIGIIVINSIGIVLFNWHSKTYLKYLGISTLLSEIIVLIGFVGAIKWISWQFTNHILGRTADIHYSSLSYIGLSYIGISLLLLGISIFLKKTSHSTAE